jgi:hypothetical protein
MTIPSADTPKSTNGNANKPLSLASAAGILNEDANRVLAIAGELEPKFVCLQRLAGRIERHTRLSSGQKEQALHFLFHPAYTKDGYAIALQYLKLCLNPRYTARGTAWKAR